MKKLHALVLGSTGATWKEMVKLLLEDSNFKFTCKIWQRQLMKVDD